MVRRSKGATIALCVLSIVRLGGCFTFTGSAHADGRTSRHTTAVHSTSAAKDKVACADDVDVRRRTPSDEMEKVTAERVSARGGFPVDLSPAFSQFQFLSTYAYVSREAVVRSPDTCVLYMLFRLVPSSMLSVLGQLCTTRSR